MDDKKRERLMRELQRAAADFILHNSNREPLITVTNVTFSQKDKKAHILVSVFPEQEEERALTYLKRKESEARNYFREHVRVGFLPTITFAIDDGEKARRKFDALLESEKGGTGQNDTV